MRLAVETLGLGHVSIGPYAGRKPSPPAPLRAAGFKPPPHARACQRKT